MQTLIGDSKLNTQNDKSSCPYHKYIKINYIPPSSHLEKYKSTLITSEIRKICIKIWSSSSSSDKVSSHTA